MKKILLILVAFLGIIVNTSAKDYATCVIKNGNGASVAVTVIDYSGKDVRVSLSSDCDHPVLVNFYFKFYVPYNNGYEQTSQTFTEIVEPNKSDTKTYTLKVRGEKISNISDVVIVESARCEK